MAVIELRRYRLHPGHRERLIALFEERFIEPQEEAGMTVLGQFRDIDDPDSFVWLRAFPDMAARAEALAGFYGGPVWAAHRDAANATMINSDNVLLLRPAGGTPVPTPRHPAAGSAEEPGGIVLCTVSSVAPGAENDFAQLFSTRIRPELEEGPGAVLASLVTERSPNSFPRLPVREGESVHVSVLGFADAGSYAVHVGRLAASSRWQALAAEIDARLWRPNEVLRLAPTARSTWRGRL
jgi:hypothetical protein